MKDKICISIDQDVLAKIKAISILENRNISNSIESLVDISKYNFIEITDKTTNKKIYIASYDPKP